MKYTLDTLKLRTADETDAIVHILQSRRVARAGRIRRQAHRTKEAGWIKAERALKLAGMSNPCNLQTALKTGQVRCRFQHVGRWWQSKDVPDEMWRAVQNGARLIGADGASRVDSDQWVLRVNEEDWREHLGKPAAAAASADVPPAAKSQIEASTLSAALSPQAPKVRATKRTTIEEYTAFQNDYLKKYGAYASKDTEKIWAEAKGCSARHVRKELRPQYRDGLPPAERAKFQSHNKKAQPLDDGR